MDTANLLSTKDAAKKLCVSEPMIRKLAQLGAFKGAIKIGHIWRIPSSTVERAMHEGIQYPEKK